MCQLGAGPGTGSAPQWPRPLVVLVCGSGALSLQNNLVVVAQVFNPGTQEAEAKAAGSQGQLSLQNEVQDSQGYKEKRLKTKPNQTNQPVSRRRGGGGSPGPLIKE